MRERHRILLVCDESFGEVLKPSLADGGFDADCVEPKFDPGLVLAALRRRAYDAVIATNNGFSWSDLPPLVTAILRKHPQTRVLVASGYVTLAFAQDLVRRGADDLLPLPVEVSDLITALERALARRASPPFDPLHLLKENMPVDQFGGLSANEFRALVRSPLGASPAVALRDHVDDHVLDAIPFFRLVEALLRIVRRDGAIRLTKTGALPRSILTELYELRLLTEEVIESGIVTLRREEDCRFLWSLHAVAEISRVVRKSRGRLALTKLGERLLLSEDRSALFFIVLRTFVDEFNWAANDRHADASIAQLGSGFSLYLLGMNGGEKRTMGFYADRYFAAFPHLSQAGTSDRPEFAAMMRRSAYRDRVFTRFLEWFGFVETEGVSGFGSDENTLARRTTTFEAVFSVGR